MKHLDWSESPLFAAYSDYIDSKTPEHFTAMLGPVVSGLIYSDVELEYIISLIRKLQPSGT